MRRQHDRSQHSPIICPSVYFHLCRKSMIHNNKSRHPRNMPIYLFHFNFMMKINPSRLKALSILLQNRLSQPRPIFHIKTPLDDGDTLNHITLCQSNLEIFICYTDHMPTIIYEMKYSDLKIAFSSKLVLQ